VRVCRYLNVVSSPEKPELDGFRPGAGEGNDASRGEFVTETLGLIKAEELWEVKGLPRKCELKKFEGA